ncbi:MAG: hypothetical protein AAF098_08870 [Pseudomonadota bacterium]
MLTENHDLRPYVASWKSLTSKALRPEWLGQTVASLAWIASVFVVGVSGSGDWLQLLAASSWFVSNVASLFTTDSTND